MNILDTEIRVGAAQPFCHYAQSCGCRMYAAAPCKTGCGYVIIKGTEMRQPSGGSRHRVF